MYTYDLKPGERLPVETVREIIAKNPSLTKIQKYKTYYDGQNPDILHKYRENLYKGITPNKTVTSPYPSTLADTAAAYCFSDIVRSDRKDDTYDNEAFLQDFNRVMLNNDADVVDKKNGSRQCGIGVSYVIHWVDKSMGGDLKDQLRFNVIDTPENCTPVYSSDFSQRLNAFIYVQKTNDMEIATVYYDDAIQTIDLESGAVAKTRNDYGIIPVEIYYNSDTTGDIKPVYAKVLDYINLTDHIMTGNFNEVERFKNAILSLARGITEENKADIHNLQLLQDMADDWDKIKFITKEIPVDFQKWVYDMAVREIHKHTGIIDFFDPEGGITSATSAKAMFTRMLVMNMNADSWELWNRAGQYRRIRIIGGFLGFANPARSIKIEYNRVSMDDFFDNLQKVQNVTLVSRQTLHERIGLDTDEEAKRLEEEAKQQTSELRDLLNRATDEPETSTEPSE